MTFLTIEIGEQEKTPPKASHHCHHTLIVRPCRSFSIRPLLCLLLSCTKLKAPSSSRKGLKRDGPSAHLSLIPKQASLACLLHLIIVAYVSYQYLSRRREEKKRRRSERGSLRPLTKRSR